MLERLVLKESEGNEERKAAGLRREERRLEWRAVLVQIMTSLILHSCGSTGTVASSLIYVSCGQCISYQCISWSIFSRVV
jgi:hypothetical protein